jgi:hypothetical protein
MALRSFVAAAAAVVLTSSPVVAADVSRSAAPVSAASQAEGEGWLLAILAIILAALGLYLLANNDDDTPGSP